MTIIEVIHKFYPKKNILLTIGLSAIVMYAASMQKVI